MRGSSAAELAADIERRVTDSILQPGDRLPPVRVLAAELRLAPNTVAAAYRRLGERGIVVGRGRSGTFVANRPPLAIATELAVPEDLWDLSTGNPDPALLPDLWAVARQLHGATTLYGGRSVDETLTEEGARLLSLDGVPSNHLTVVSGALDGIERVLQAHVRRGDRVAIEDPAYAPVIDLIGALGLVAVPVTIDDEGPLPESLGDAVASGVSALIVTPRAQNPFGSAISTDRAASLRSVLAGSPQVLVIEDDHAAAVAGAAMHRISADREHWATVRSTAKAYGPDLRLALLAGDATTVRRVEGRQRLGPGWVSHLLQQLSARMMSDPAVNRVVAQAANSYASRRGAMLAALHERGFEAHGTSGLNVWVPVPDETATVQAMEKQGIAVRSGARFRIRTEPAVRVTVATLDRAQTDQVANALHAAVTELGPGTRSG
ncbi:MAG: aminotransferase class I/II-fold pyridoxal phosphate-dependent enzyme [Actinomycetota bacterium]|nr:aminotransferase class I/II-fold pyridoxal phosphate-dependent enzyme [Actinomycetota bacterium]